MNITSKVNCQYGAPMGRCSWNNICDQSFNGRFYLQNARLDRGGYDAGGAYWGIGKQVFLYRAADDSISGSLRAYSRKDAKLQILALHPDAKFFN